MTERIMERSAKRRSAYVEQMRAAAGSGPNRAHMGCSNLAHAYAAMGQDQERMATSAAPNIGIVTAYNDMLSAHQPFGRFPDLIKSAARTQGATAQIAGGVPAMCDGVTQSQPGMELSLFSRDVIALSAGVALSHNVFDAAVFLGTCDKIVPGLIMAAGTFGHIPSIFLPGGPMPSGLANDEKAKVRQQFASGEVGRDGLMRAEMSSYHSPGTCTFYGTANSNQMLMEIMGLQLPGSSFVAPNTDLRDALTDDGTRAVLRMAERGTIGADVLGEKAFVNGIVGLMATGGSTNLVLHLPAMARAAGIVLRLEDFDDLSQATPLIARVYPNGLADVNHFHAAGGMGYVISQLLESGLLHEDVETVAGPGLARYCDEPKLVGDRLIFEPCAKQSLNDAILKPVAVPFQATGGLRRLQGNLGRGLMKVSAVAPELHVITAPAKVFDSQDSVKEAFKAGDLEGDHVIVVRFQGPKFNGMPELHGLTPVLSILQGRGHKVALVTDGRMSGASGKIPSAIHVTPEAAEGGEIAKIRDGDMVTVDAVIGLLQCAVPDIEDRAPAAPPESDHLGSGRELFDMFRRAVGGSEEGASVVLRQEDEYDT